MIIDLSLPIEILPDEDRGRVTLKLLNGKIEKCKVVQVDGIEMLQNPSDRGYAFFDLPLRSKKPCEDFDRFHVVTYEQDVYFGDIPRHLWVQIREVSDGWRISFGDMDKRSLTMCVGMAK